MSHSFAVDGVDHVELYVRDWEDSAAWYERVLGLTPDERFEQWWVDREGPLVLSADAGGGSDAPGVDGGSGADGATKLALFERETATRGQDVSPHRVAFRTDADGFRSFLDRLETLDLTDREGDPVTADDVRDHGLSVSVYFTDPDGNRFELTTNDHERVAARLD